MKEKLDRLQKMKRKRKIVALTAHDYPTAKILNEAELDLILVGDSLGMTVLGYENTRSVTIDDMVHHTRAVARGNTNSVLVADLPYLTYETVGSAIKNSKDLIDANADAVKLEGDRQEVISALVEAKIPVMGHVGLLPQTADRFAVRGRKSADAQKIIESAKSIESAGAFSIVLESIPDQLAIEITETLEIPTIGIGAGVGCDGQILVLNDLLGLFDRFRPKFVKRYSSLKNEILKAVETYKFEVREEKFPDEQHSYS